MATDPAEIPHGIRSVYRRFERWRSAHGGARLPIPEALWAAAAEVAREHGVFHTARALRLDYSKLKRMAESGGSTGSSDAAPTSFVELVASPAMGEAECLIELERPGGKIRIQWKGTTGPDLVGLSRALWELA